MDKELKAFLSTGYTPYQAVENSAAMLEKAGFKRLGALPEKFGEGDKFFVSDSGALVAFTRGKGEGFNIVASHTDSPALRLKTGVLPGGRLNCEVYGGALRYPFFDIPLRICGRVFVKDGGGVKAKNVVSPYFVTVPSLAVHLNRGVNDNFAPSAQTDMTPLIGESADFLSGLAEGEIVESELYACPALEPYESGAKAEYLSSPRLDNLTSVYCSLKAFISARPCGINVCALFNGEETGSRIRRGAGAMFFPEMLKAVYAAAGGRNFAAAISSSLMLSADNAHATHPAHPEKSDPVAKVRLGGGIVVKHHPNYATDGLTSSAAKLVFEKAGVPVQDFYSNADSPCGGTLGLIAAATTDIRTCDIGIAQLAMHSSVETCGGADIKHMIKGLESFYGSRFEFSDSGVKVE